MRRKIYNRLLEWKNMQGCCALLIEGARRIGKTYISQKFAKEEYKSHIYIDFTNPNPETIKCFEEDFYDIDLFLSKLAAIYGTRLYKRESLIIFDEVQQFPKARQAIKHLVADGRYDYLETGSLITLHANVKDILIPSEELHIKMFPMDFEEFLWALGDEATMPYVEKCFAEKIPIGQQLNRKIINEFRKYMLVGGMPQAVVEYRKNYDFKQADRIKKQILTLYSDDIMKYAGKDSRRAISIFTNIPGQLAKHEKKYQLTKVNHNARMREYEDAFIWLEKSMIINRSVNATNPTVGLRLNEDNTTQKLYLNDTGLLITLAFMDDDFADNDLYKSILLDKLHVNEGMIMENIVAQMLASSGKNLYFYSTGNANDRQNKIEIDFLISDHKRVCPVEVKSAGFKAHTSLDKYIKRFGGKIGQPYILYTKDLMEREGVLHLPVYMAGLL